MRVLVYLPLLASLVLALAGPRLSRRMPPRTGTRLLLVAALTCALTTQLSLAFLALALVGRLPLVAAVGAWSADRIGDDDPVQPSVAALAAMVFVLLAAAFAVTGVRRLRALRRARRAARLLDGGAHLVVLDDDRPEAFSVPAGHRSSGRIVVSRGMLGILQADERRVLLAHENSHLRHRHHRYRILASLATAADPLLAPLPAAIHHLTERWADEDAAAVIADRRLTARALARTALEAQRARRTAPAGAGVLCFHHDDVPGRVRALLAGAPARRPAASAVLAAVVLISLVSAVRAGADTAELFDSAGDVYHARPLPIGTAVSDETGRLLTAMSRGDPASAAHRGPRLSEHRTGTSQHVRAHRGPRLSEHRTGTSQHVREPATAVGSGRSLRW